MTPPSTFLKNSVQGNDDLLLPQLIIPEKKLQGYLKRNPRKSCQVVKDFG
jgi:hypothetical protein